jgi:hypothetical protein
MKDEPKSLGIDFVGIVQKISSSGLTYSSRQLIYCRLINEVWHCKYDGLMNALGIDTAFDEVYRRSIVPSQYEDDSFIGC